MQDDGGEVLGRLPRSRPGTRSGKRDGKAARPATGPSPPSASRESAPPGPAAGDDPLAGAVRAVAGVAGAGARVASTLARETLRRLPRP